MFLRAELIGTVSRQNSMASPCKHCIEYFGSKKVMNILIVGLISYTISRVMKYNRSQRQPLPHNTSKLVYCFVTKTSA
jgi:hypothetical protein